MTALSKREEFPVSDFESKKDLIKKIYFKGCTDDEVEVFLHICKRTGLDPMAKQIYPIPRWSSEHKKNVMTPQTSIDGFRLVAERTGRYSPGREATYVYETASGPGKSTEREYENRRLISATSYVKKMTPDGTWHEIAATAFYDEYVQKTKEGKVTQFWDRMPHVMLAKCAESLALRKAFPADLSGLYTAEEMEQASNPQSALVDLKREQIGQIISIIGRDENRMQLLLGHYKVTALNQMTMEQIEHCLEHLKEKDKNKEIPHEIS